MSIPHVTPGLIDRIDTFNASFHTARMSAVASLDGNPFGVEILAFGNTHGVACKILHPFLRGKNRIIGFTPEDCDHLDGLLKWYRDENLSCSLSVRHGQMTDVLFGCLVGAGLWSAGSSTVPAIVPDGRADDSAPSTPPEIVIRVSGPEERELYLDVFQQAFADRDECASEYRAFQWSEDSLPGGMRYIAEIDGQPVGMASMPVVTGIGFLGTGGVLPHFRGRGVQMALIRRRIADAQDLGCDLILGGGSLGSPPYRNFERAGLRLIPTAMTWGDVRS
jgi:GNAT superfamily N-acetyltransferase